ncbi:hypothetical protein JCM19300_2828 [Algibacter lectus]|uniref:Uncharacterized protein n=2 Tax=Algibacter lectus TaxID=221126 RepID=A0A090WC23_9FLAO|nr:hypothetical protein JCM19300_2828 [Algibacter lectus]
MIGEISLLKEGQGHPSGLGALRKLTIGNIKLEEDIVALMRLIISVMLLDQVECQ